MGRVFQGEEQPEELRDPEVDESSDDDDDGDEQDLGWLLGQVQDLVDREEEPEDEVLAGVLQGAELGDADHLAELLPTLQVSIDTRVRPRAAPRCRGCHRRRRSSSSSSAPSPPTSTDPHSTATSAHAGP
jgi:hypothetical protein